ncbi:hypothetical protein VdG1_05789 [Verticillium dahliae VDG1]|nr:hypothetical protein VdG1_05789 [Verticillium dahliae VDG1]
MSDNNTQSAALPSGSPAASPIVSTPSGAATTTPANPATSPSTTAGGSPAPVPSSPTAVVPSPSTPPAPATTSTTSQPPPPAPSTSTSAPAPPPEPSTTSTPPAPETTTQPTTSEQAPASTQITTVESSVVTNPGGQTSTVIRTITTPAPRASTTSESTAATSTGTSGPISPGGGGGGGLSSGGKIAVAVVVPIVAVALIILAGLYFWRKRKAKKDAEEERRKEVEDYAYNPNADPTIPAVGGAGGDGSYEMREDASSAGYRGWGTTTLAGSTGRKASTTMSGGNTGQAYSDITSQTHGNVSDTRSGEHLLNENQYGGDGEILGAMGPSAALNRANGVQRGPSNASSSYSAAGRSDGSSAAEGIGMAYSGAGGNGYYDQYGSSNPYGQDAYNGDGRPSELPGQPIIQDNPARRNTRIESPSHYPQQSAGISQNF